MNHQPFETWLLDDQLLSSEQKRELESHLHICTHCAALAETGLALHTRSMASPAPGFTARFQARLEVQRFAERRKRFWGVILFTIAGLGVTAWLVAPLLQRLAGSPAEWISLIVSFALFVAASLQALVEVGFVLLRVAPGFIPPFFWMMLASGVAGLGLLWTVSVWRLTRLPQGAR
jgi:hypothetical protein